MLAGAIAGDHKMKFAMGVAVFFLIGEIANVFMLPSPMWYTVVILLELIFLWVFCRGRLRSGNKCKSC